MNFMKRHKTRVTLMEQHSCFFSLKKKIFLTNISNTCIVALFSGLQVQNISVGKGKVNEKSRQRGLFRERGCDTPSALGILLPLPSQSQDRFLPFPEERLSSSGLKQNLKIERVGKGTRDQGDQARAAHSLGNENTAGQHYICKASHKGRSSHGP